MDIWNCYFDNQISVQRLTEVVTGYIESGYQGSNNNKQNGVQAF